MLVTEMITQIDAHGFTDLATAIKLQAISDAQDDFCQRGAWPFLETDVTVNTVSGSWVLTVASDVSSVLSVFDTVDNFNLKYMRYETLHNTYSSQITNVAQDTASYFYFKGTEVRLFPTPNSVRALRVLYMKYPTPIALTSDALTIPLRYHRIVLLGALAYLYLMNDAETMADRFQARMEQRIQTSLNDIYTRQYSNPDSVAITSSTEYQDVQY